MGKAKCIKSMSIERYDDDGFLIENKYMEVKEGSVWNVDEGVGRIIGGEVSLTNSKGSWMEMSQEAFKECFEVITQ